MQGRKGRPTRDYEPSWGGKIEGLYRRSDGRWMDRVNGFIWSERDERKAVSTFLARKQKNVRIEAEYKSDSYPVAAPMASVNGSPMPIDIVDTLAAGYIGDAEPPTLRIGYEIPEQLVWEWVRDQLVMRPLYVAERTGISALASLADLPLPTPSPKLSDVFVLYKNFSGTSKANIANAAREWATFRKLTGAGTLRELTAENLLNYRQSLAKYSGSTIATKVNKIIAIIGFAKTQGVDAAQVRAALDKCAVLRGLRKKKNKMEPKPIDIADFRSLLIGADPELRAMLLLSLNACLYLSEALAVEWEEIELENQIKTFSTARHKTGIRRSAVLWSETVDAIKALKRRGESPYLFCSSHGTKYNVNSYRKKFARLCDAVGVKAEFNQMRDGAYSAAVASQVNFGLCQLLAGHRLPGQADHYVSRNPMATRPATEAIHKWYYPFPASKPAVKIGRPRLVKVA